MTTTHNTPQLTPALAAAIAASLASVGGAYVYVAAIFNHQNGGTR